MEHIENILINITNFEKDNKINHAMKSVYDIEYYINNNDFESVQYFLNKIIDNNNLNILISVLTATQDVKTKCGNIRENIFNKAEQLAINKIGFDKLNKSIFHSLK